MADADKFTNRMSQFRLAVSEEEGGPVGTWHGPFTDVESARASVEEALTEHAEAFVQELVSTPLNEDGVIEEARWENVD